MLCSVDHDSLVWAVIRTKPRREKVAVERIRARGCDAYLPRILEKFKTRGVVPKPLFPGYVFAQIIPRRDLLKVRWAPGVLRILGHDDRIVCMDNQAIARIREREADKGYIEFTVKRRFKKNDRVAIKSGPFRGFEGVFQGYLSGAERVRLLLDYVYYQHEVELERSRIARA